MQEGTGLRLRVETGEIPSFRQSCGGRTRYPKTKRPDPHHRARTARAVGSARELPRQSPGQTGERCCPRRIGGPSFESRRERRGRMGRADHRAKALVGRVVDVRRKERLASSMFTSGSEPVRPVEIDGFCVVTIICSEGVRVVRQPRAQIHRARRSAGRKLLLCLGRVFGLRSGPSDDSCETMPRHAETTRYAGSQTSERPYGGTALPPVLLGNRDTRCAMEVV